MALNIIEFAKWPDLLNIQSLSPGQETLLRTYYGLPLDETQLEIYRRACGRDAYVPQEQNEMDVIAGRRSGKTGYIAAPIVCFEALRDHGLPRGERGYVLLIAPVIAQARIGFRFIRKYFLGSRTLSQYVFKIRGDEIELRNGVVIACVACSYVTVRGMTVVAAVCDEMAFWQHEEIAASPEEEVLEALRPAMATVKRAKLLKISTPFRKEGTLYRDFQRRAELDYPVWQCSTAEMNPSIQTSVLAKERQRNLERFEREYNAQFTENIISWIAPEVLDACIVRGRTELPRVENVTYVAAVDPAFVRNDFALAILHRPANGPLVVDRVERWAGTKKVPLGYEWVCEEILHIVKEYGIHRVLGDQYCAPVIQQHLQKLGISYKPFTFGARTRADLFGNLKHALVQRKIELLDDPVLLHQLRALEEHAAAGGNVDIRPSYNQKDDVAITVALAAAELSRSGDFYNGLIEYFKSLEHDPRDPAPACAVMHLR